MANNNRKKKKSKTTVEVATSKQQQQPVVVGSWEWVAEDRTGNRSKKRKDKEQDQEEEEAVVALVISPTVTSSHGTSSGTPTISATTTTTATASGSSPRRRHGRHGRRGGDNFSSDRSGFVGYSIPGVPASLKEKVKGGRTELLTPEEGSGGVEKTVGTPDGRGGTQSEIGDTQEDEYDLNMGGPDVDNYPELPTATSIASGRTNTRRRKTLNPNTYIQYEYKEEENYLDTNYTNVNMRRITLLG